MSGLDLVRSRTLSCQRRTCAFTRSRSMVAAGLGGVAADSINGVSPALGEQEARVSEYAYYSQRAATYLVCARTLKWGYWHIGSPAASLAENAPLTNRRSSRRSSPFTLRLHDSRKYFHGRHRKQAERDDSLVRNDQRRFHRRADGRDDEGRLRAELHLLGDTGP